MKYSALLMRTSDGRYYVLIDDGPEEAKEFSTVEDAIQSAKTYLYRHPFDQTDYGPSWEIPCSDARVIFIDKNRVTYPDAVWLLSYGDGSQCRSKCRAFYGGSNESAVEEAYNYMKERIYDLVDFDEHDNDSPEDYVDWSCTVLTDNTPGVTYKAIYSNDLFGYDKAAKEK